MNWRPALSQRDIDAVRELRNAGRHWFGSSADVEPQAHRAWMNEQWSGPFGDFSCIVVADSEIGPAIGYGMLRRREGRLWVALAVATAEHGRGIGAGIYQLLRSLADEPIFAAIRRDNAASLRAARKAGFVDELAITPPGVEHRDQWLVLRG